MDNTELCIGSTYGFLTVMALSDIRQIGHGHIMHKYLCRCVCGNEIEVYQGELISGHIKSCGCKSNVRKQALKYDMHNQRFGRLVVVEQAETLWSDSGKSRMVRWRCRCDCGNDVVVNSRALRTGATTSCGCYQKERVSDALTDDLTGQKFGHLTVVERSGSYCRKGRTTGIMAMWLCKCDCGNEIVTTGYSLKCGDTTSCGCSKVSLGEEYINQILIDNGYVLDKTYFKEKTFPDLKSDCNGVLRFDFVVMTNAQTVCIEYQGAQHYKSVEWFGGEESFKQRLANDSLKRQWCHRHNYRLIEIPYTARSLDEISCYLTELVNRESE